MKNKFIFLALAAVITPSLSLCMRSSKVVLALEGKPTYEAVRRLRYTAVFEAALCQKKEEFITEELERARGHLFKTKALPVEFQKWKIEFLEASLAENNLKWRRAQVEYKNACDLEDKERHD